MVCAFDISDDVKESLVKSKFNIQEGTTGSTIKVLNKNRNDQKLLNLNYESPSNLHEFDIVIFDMTKGKEEKYDQNKHTIKSLQAKKAVALLSQYPQDIFDPRPFSINIISGEISELLTKSSIVIVFCSTEVNAHYDIVEIDSYQTKISDSMNYSNLNFYSGLPQIKSRTGKRVKISSNNKLSSLLEKHLDKVSYGTTFIHPKKWFKQKTELDNSFIPLLENDQGEVVSYFHTYNEGSVFVFPDFENKESFTSELLNSVLPDMFPDLFPYHGQFGWLSNGEYLLPGEEGLLQKKAELEFEFENNLQSIKESIDNTRVEYNFLHDLISQSGDELVKAIQKYMIWLGFESVIDMDEQVIDVFEEDLQIETDKGLLVIEIKGIGGTSTDKACSQISKIKYRRAEERGKFDVFGLYIVNHQRYMAPKSRTNPPFTENQLKDSVREKRGLLTTYDLYQAYFMIEKGVLSKCDVRNSLYEFGLVSLEPKDLILIGTPSEIFKNGTVAILNLSGNCTITKGTTLIARKDGGLSNLVVDSIQLDGVDVDEASSGEVGICLSIPIKKSTELLMKA
ncbi:hypothetical protein C9J12_11665 [Photobacterium frigidiphilum]|uniref:Uncharacterized protein n=2 Tax=Photobacterium frigidiphilum TaxID=264736 RepID=A0A2T3JHE7_9GAMM|nr:hypothetical protein C9J12_11665 [Photobacterium frigidiphilum]